MDVNNTLALFRAHATARLRGDTDETTRLTRQFTDTQRRTHLLFAQTLFACIVVDRLGTRPDPQDLADFTKVLHDKHFEANNTFNALRAEAMIRSLFDEAHLLFEIPYNEQPTYMWAVMEALIDPDIPDAELSALLHDAEEFAATSLEDAQRSLTETFAAQKPPRDSGSNPTDRPDEPGTPGRSPSEPADAPGILGPQAPTHTPSQAPSQTPPPPPIAPPQSAPPKPPAREPAPNSAPETAPETEPAPPPETTHSPARTSASAPSATRTSDAALSLAPGSASTSASGPASPPETTEEPSKPLNPADQASEASE